MKRARAATGEGVRRGVYNGSYILTLFLIVFHWGILGCSTARYSGLLSWEEYRSGRQWEPHVVQLGDDSQGGRLLYYGVYHTQRAGDPQIRDIERYWREFQPDVVFCEGGIWPLETTRGHAIEKHGEQGLLRYMSNRDSVCLKSLETRRVREGMQLLKDFSPEQIKVFYVLRQALIRRLMGREIGETDYVVEILREFSRGPFRATRPNSLAQFECCVGHMLPDLADWRQIPEGYFYDANGGNWLARMYRMVNDIRNQVMVAKILKELRKGKRVFVVAGRSHAVMQEPVLRAHLQKHR